MVTAASLPGSRMPNPRKAARSIASLIQWQAEGFDFALDILPAIADVCSRASDPDKPVVSWHYFTGAIRDWHARRTRQVSRPRVPPAPARGMDAGGLGLLRKPEAMVAISTEFMSRAYGALKSELGRRACAEGWGIALHDFIAEQGVWPDAQQQDRLRANAAEKAASKPS